MVKDILTGRLFFGLLRVSINLYLNMLGSDRGERIKEYRSVSRLWQDEHLIGLALNVHPYREDPPRYLLSGRGGTHDKTSELFFSYRPI